VVADVPALDLVNLDQAPVLHMIGKGEYGDPLVPDELAWLKAISPLESPVAANYLATLVICGANDPRCPAGHSRQFVHQLEGLQTGTAPILLRVHKDQGHGAAGADARAHRTAEWLAFCAEHTGLVL
jgi:prolyl oligopeptidase